MKLNRSIDLVESVPAKWKKQYYDCNREWTMVADPRGSKQIYDELIAAQPLIAAEANRIIGNDSWTELSCNECGKSKDSVVHFGEETDHESYTFYLCEECLKSALRLIRNKI